MRKEYGKALRALFTAEMNSRVPQFVATKVKSPYLFPGEQRVLLDSTGADPVLGGLATQPQGV